MELYIDPDLRLLGVACRIDAKTGFSRHCSSGFQDVVAINTDLNKHEGTVCRGTKSLG